MSAAFRAAPASLPRAPRRAGRLAMTAALVGALFACALPAGAPVAMAQDTGVCEIGRPVIFAGLDYDSAQFHNAVAKYLLRHGFGCAVDELPGSVIPLINGMARGDVDINMEIWRDNVTAAWDQAEADGKVIDLGTNFPDAIQGWFVPRYLVDGAGAPAPDLRSVSDLPRYKQLFTDPEEPGKGRFYNCIAGWNCEIINTRKLAAYGLDRDFTNFRPGTATALDAAIESAILRKRPVLFYYWGPTWLLGKIGERIVMLDEPAFDPVVWKALSEQDNPAAATAYPTVEVHVGANRAFAEAAPRIATFLGEYEFTGAQVSQALAYMQDNNATADEAAVNFLRNNERVWKDWLPADAAARVTAALAN